MHIYSYLASYEEVSLGRETLKKDRSVLRTALNASAGEFRRLRYVHTIGESAPSLRRESIDSLIVIQMAFKYDQIIVLSTTTLLKFRLLYSDYSYLMSISTAVYEY